MLGDWLKNGEPVFSTNKKKNQVHLLPCDFPHTMSKLQVIIIIARNPDWFTVLHVCFCYDLVGVIILVLVFQKSFKKHSIQF